MKAEWWQTVNAAPYQFSIDSKSFKAGDHAIALSVKTASGETKLGELSVQYAAKSGGGGGSLAEMAALTLGVVVVLLALFFVLRRRRGRGDAPPQPVS